MTDQTPETASTSDYSIPLRVWHWSTALLVSGLLLTILFLKVIVNVRSAIPEFQQALAHDGLTLTRDQGREIAHIIADRIWDWHVVLGLLLAAFWLLRVLLELRGPAPVRFVSRLRLAFRNYRQNRQAAVGESAGTILYAKSTYAAFYLMLTVMVATGLLLTWADDYELLHRIEHPVKEVHEVTMYLIMAFFAAHVVGVVWSELTKDRGLVSRMISGKR